MIRMHYPAHKLLPASAAVRISERRDKHKFVCHPRTGPELEIICACLPSACCCMVRVSDGLRSWSQPW